MYEIGKNPVHHKKFILERKNIMKKRFAIKGFSFVLVLAMLIVGMVVVPAAAETTTPKYAPDETWGADEDGVYRIYDAPDLLKFLSTVKLWNDGDSYEGKTVNFIGDPNPVTSLSKIWAEHGSTVSTAFAELLENYGTYNSPD